MGSIKLKTKNEVDIIRQGGKVLAATMEKLIVATKAGVLTGELNVFAGELCSQYKVTPAFLGYRGYPANICIGVNDTVVHGIPSKNEILKKGDIVSLDFGIIHKDYYSDMAVTIGIGQISKAGQKLIQVTRDALNAGIKQATSGNTIGDIGFAIDSTVRKGGFSVVRQMVGHGIGQNLHEDPYVPGYGNKGEGQVLRDGMVIAIEAIINEGKEAINFLEDGWTTKTADGKLSAIFEHTVAIGGRQAEILTKA